VAPRDILDLLVKKKFHHQEFEAGCQVHTCPIALLSYSVPNVNIENILQ